MTDNTRVKDVKYLSARAIKREFVQAGVQSISAESVDVLNHLLAEFFQNIMQSIPANGASSSFTPELLETALRAVVPETMWVAAVAEAKKLLEQETNNAASSDVSIELIISTDMVDDKAVTRDADHMRRFLIPYARILDKLMLHFDLLHGAASATQTDSAGSSPTLDLSVVFYVTGMLEHIGSHVLNTVENHAITKGKLSVKMDDVFVALTEDSVFGETFQATEIRKKLERKLNKKTASLRKSANVAPKESDIDGLLNMTLGITKEKRPELPTSNPDISRATEVFSETSTVDLKQPESKLPEAQHAAPVADVTSQVITSTGALELSSQVTSQATLDEKQLSLSASHRSSGSSKARPRTEVFEEHAVFASKDDESSMPAAKLEGLLATLEEKKKRPRYLVRDEVSPKDLLRNGRPRSKSATQSADSLETYSESQRVTETLLEILRAGPDEIMLKPQQTDGQNQAMTKRARFIVEAIKAALPKADSKAKPPNVSKIVEVPEYSADARLSVTATSSASGAVRFQAREEPKLKSSIDIDPDTKEQMKKDKQELVEFFRNTGPNSPVSRLLSAQKQKQVVSESNINVSGSSIHSATKSAEGLSAPVSTNPASSKTSPTNSIKQMTKDDAQPAKDVKDSSATAPAMAARNPKTPTVHDYDSDEDDKPKRKKQESLSDFLKNSEPGDYIKPVPLKKESSGSFFNLLRPRTQSSATKNKESNPSLASVKQPAVIMLEDVAKSRKIEVASAQQDGAPHSLIAAASVAPKPEVLTEAVEAIAAAAVTPVQVTLATSEKSLKARSPKGAAQDDEDDERLRDKPKRKKESLADFLNSDPADFGVKQPVAVEQSKKSVINAAFNKSKAKGLQKPEGTKPTGVIMLGPLYKKEEASTETRLPLNVTLVSNQDGAQLLSTATLVPPHQARDSALTVMGDFTEDNRASYNTLFGNTPDSHNSIFSQVTAETAADVDQSVAQIVETNEDSQENSQPVEVQISQPEKALVVQEQEARLETDRFDQVPLPEHKGNRNSAIPTMKEVETALIAKDKRISLLPNRDSPIDAYDLKRENIVLRQRLYRLQLLHQKLLSSVKGRGKESAAATKILEQHAQLKATDNKLAEATPDHNVSPPLQGSEPNIFKDQQIDKLSREVADQKIIIDILRQKLQNSATVQQALQEKLDSISQRAFNRINELVAEKQALEGLLDILGKDLQLEELLKTGSDDDEQLDLDCLGMVLGTAEGSEEAQDQMDTDFVELARNIIDEYSLTEVLQPATETQKLRASIAMDRTTNSIDDILESLRETSEPTTRDQNV